MVTNNGISADNYLLPHPPPGNTYKSDCHYLQNGCRCHHKPRIHTLCQTVLQGSPELLTLFPWHINNHIVLHISPHQGLGAMIHTNFFFASKTNGLQILQFRFHRLAKHLQPFSQMYINKQLRDSQKQ